MTKEIEMYLGIFSFFKYNKRIKDMQVMNNNTFYNSFRYTNKN